MKANLGDKLLVHGIECVVVYVNNGNAWVSPVNDEEMLDGNKLYKNCAFDVVNQKGRTKNGSKVYSIINADCGAV